MDVKQYPVRCARFRGKGRTHTATRAAAATTSQAAFTEPDSDSDATERGDDVEEEWESDTSNASSELPNRKRPRTQLKGDGSKYQLRGKERHGPSSRDYYQGVKVPGVYLKKGGDMFEAQLNMKSLREMLEGQIETSDADCSEKRARKLKPDAVYLGLYHFSASNKEHKKKAREQSSQAIARAALKFVETKGIDPNTCMEKLKVLFPQLEEEDLMNAKEAAYRAQFPTFDAYVQELVGAAQRWQADGSSKPSKGVSQKNNKKGTAYEARYSRLGLKTFGRYKNKADAIEAFDIGTILIFGTVEKSLNEPILTYMTDGKFKQDVEIPPQVQESVQAFLNLKDSEEHQQKKELARVQSYFADGSCPFYDPRNMS